MHIPKICIHDDCTQAILTNLENNQQLEDIYCKGDDDLDNSLSLDENIKNWLTDLNLNWHELLSKNKVGTINKYNLNFYPHRIGGMKPLLLSFKNIQSIDLSTNNNLSVVPLYDFCFVFPDLKTIIIDEPLINQILNISEMTNDMEHNLLALIGWRNSHNPTGQSFDAVPPGFRKFISRFNGSKALILDPMIMRPTNPDKETMYKINRLYRTAYITFFQIDYFLKINSFLIGSTGLTFLLKTFFTMFSNFIRSTIKNAFTCYEQYLYCRNDGDIHYVITYRK
jgi:hypothetical protein